MHNNWLVGLKNFVIGTMLTVVLWGLSGVISNLLMGFMDQWGIIELYRLIIFVFYWFILNWWIYGTSEKQRRYLDSLPRDHKITLKEDYFVFLKQEALPIFVYYTIGLSLQVFVFGFIKGYFQTFFVILAPIGLELPKIGNWILSFVLFVVGYQAIAIFYRWRIRKDRYHFLFEHK